MNGADFMNCVDPVWKMMEELRSIIPDLNNLGLKVMDWHTSLTLGLPNNDCVGTIIIIPFQRDSMKFSLSFCSAVIRSETAKGLVDYLAATWGEFKTFLFKTKVTKAIIMGRLSNGGVFCMEGGYNSVMVYASPKKEASSFVGSVEFRGYDNFILFGNKYEELAKASSMDDLDADIVAPAKRQMEKIQKENGLPVIAAS